MRVELEHVEKTVGFLSRQRLHGVRLTVQFSEEELHIIENRKLQSTIVAERPPSADLRLRESDYTLNRNGDVVLCNPEEFFLHIYDLMAGGETYWVETPADAKLYEEILTEQLPRLKEFIAENEGVTEKKKILEL